MLVVTAVFGVLGLGLLAMGRWGARNHTQLGTVSGFDERSIHRRRAVLRRGAYTCYAAGFVFLLLAVASLFFRSDHLSCPADPPHCSAACVATRQCPPPARG